MRGFRRAGGATLTYAEAYWAGVEPTADFAIAKAEMAADGIVLTFPGSWPADSYKVFSGLAPDSLSVANDATLGKDGANNKVTLSLPTDGVQYYKVTR